MVRTKALGSPLRHVEESSAELLLYESDETEDAINRRARNVALLISAGAMGALILIALVLRQSFSG